MRDAAEPLLRVDDLTTTFEVRKGLGGKKTVRAVSGVSFEIFPQETYALVGESGCGKTTTARTIVGLEKPTSGSIEFGGQTLAARGGSAQRRLRQKIQMIFQDPYSSLNPKKRVGRILEESILIIDRSLSRSALHERLVGVLEQVGFTPRDYHKFPNQFSGGQRQRIGIARALIADPELVICDESLSALDVSIQAEILELLQNLKSELRLSYLFVSHDLSIVRQIADRVGVMYLGRIVEESTAEQLFSNPQHPYTRSLLSAVPVPSPARKTERIVLQGEVPSPLDPPTGCSFHPRCPIAVDVCARTAPTLDEKSPRHFVSCHLVESGPSL